MSRSASPSSARDVATEYDSSFTSLPIEGHDSPLMRLPTEVREMIYRPLLVSKYTKVEHSMTTKEYDYYRRAIQDGPDQYYHFHPAIFGTSRRICEEAKDLCRRENDFVCLTSRRPSRLGHELEALGLQIVAQVSNASDFWNVSMTITLDPIPLAGWPVYHETRSPRRNSSASDDGQPWRYIFCSEELPEFSRLLLILSTECRDLLPTTTLYVNMNPAIGNGQGGEIDGNAAGLARMQKLFGPLCQLHSFGAAQVEGALSARIKNELILSVCRDCAPAAFIIEAALLSLNSANEKVSRGRLQEANLEYKAALSAVRSCCWQYVQLWDDDERDSFEHPGPFPDLTAQQNINLLAVRLRARIAATYFESGQLRMARIYTERALDPRRPYDHRHNKRYILDIEGWEGDVYAEVLHVAAKISYAHGDVKKAVGALEDAGDLAPFTEEQEATYRAWCVHRDRLIDRLARQVRTEEERKEKQDERTQELLLVACNWKDKGDRLLRRGISHLAIKKYTAALSKLDSISETRTPFFELTSGPFSGYTAADAIKALNLKTQARLAAALLMSRRYEDVIHTTETALKCRVPDCDWEHRPHYNCSHSYWDGKFDWLRDQKLDYQGLYQCMALALEHVGDMVRAVECMEKALSFDPGDRAVLALLVRLRRRREVEGAKNVKKAMKLNRGQSLLREKQRRRKEKGRL